MVQVSRSVALSVAVASVSTVLVYSSPLQYNPYTPIDTSFPLTASHPAYAGKLNDDCVQPVIPNDPNQAKAESFTPTGDILWRRLRGMEDASNTDVADLENFFKTSMELDFNTLKDKYAAAAAPSSPWAGRYWPTYQDSINHVWADGEATFGLDVTDFKNRVSANNGIDAHKSRVTCATNSDCAVTNDGSVCATRDGASIGYCISMWWGICHAWAPAAILEQEPQCDVVKNGVAFRVFDIKALLTDLYDGADLTTVFTGARFDGPGSPADTDSYGRYNNAARRDLGPGCFHIAIANIMGKQQQSFVVDVENWTNSDYEYLLELTPTTLSLAASGSANRSRTIQTSCGFRRASRMLLVLLPARI
ncbi:hypothetical protein V7S43_010461 [Phytophthora oleae]|uniref:Elicitor-like transglutaminase n=1 Tax=Phytophthora oleae TaxID=2107226 RepID=A0ABD3FCR9_9STRA